MPRGLALLALLLTLAACAPREEQATPAPAGALPAAQQPAATPQEPERSAAGERVSQAIRFGGFGPARFGAGEEAVRQAWGRGLTDGPQVEGGACRYLYFSPQGEVGPPYPLAFMIVDGTFARLDVHAAEYSAPGGGRVGMGAEEIRSRYRGRLEEQPHKYTEGKYLIVSPKKGGDARLIFETDAAATVTEWRIGLPPQVHWVEGCA